MRRLALAGVALMAMTAAGAAVAQPGPPPRELLAAQAEAMTPLAWMNGRWQGKAWRMDGGSRHDFMQTERVGPFMSGSLKVLEGKSFELDGRPADFNAFGTVSYDINKKAYTLHSYAQGRAGDFPFEPTADGYLWKIAVGPMTIRYTAHAKDGEWHETGEMVRPDGSATQIFQMDLKRTGDSDWPLAGQWTMPK